MCAYNVSMYVFRYHYAYVQKIIDKIYLELNKQLRTKYKDFYLALCISDEYIWIKGASINYVDKGPNVNDTRNLWSINKGNHYLYHILKTIFYKKVLRKNSRPLSLHKIPLQFISCKFSGLPLFRSTFL